MALGVKDLGILCFSLQVCGVHSFFPVANFRSLSPYVKVGHTSVCSLNCCVYGFSFYIYDLQRKLGSIITETNTCALALNIGFHMDGSFTLVTLIWFIKAKINAQLVAVAL